LKTIMVIYFGDWCQSESVIPNPFPPVFLSHPNSPPSPSCFHHLLSRHPRTQPHTHPLTPPLPSLLPPSSTLGAPPKPLPSLRSLSSGPFKTPPFPPCFLPPPTPPPPPPPPARKGEKRRIQSSHGSPAPLCIAGRGDSCRWSTPRPAQGYPRCRPPLGIPPRSPHVRSAAQVPWGSCCHPLGILRPPHAPFPAEPTACGSPTLPSALPRFRPVGRQGITSGSELG
jgi:hypothetical protein